MTRKTPIDISTRLYRNNHGAEPRGRGSSGFHVVDARNDTTEPLYQPVDTFFTPSMTLSDAKVWAKAKVRQDYAAELETGNLYLEVAP